MNASIRKVSWNAAVSTIAITSAWLTPMGFSQRTALPASSALMVPFGVLGMRCGHVDRVNVGVFEQGVVAPVRRDAAVVLREGVGGGLRATADGDEFGRVRFDHGIGELCGRCGPWRGFPNALSCASLL